MPTSVAGWQRNWARKCRPNSTSARGWTAIDDWQWLEDADASMIRAWHSRTICQRAHRSWKYSTWRSGDCERPKTSPILTFNFHWFNDLKDNFLEPPSGCSPASTPMLPPNLGWWGTLGNCSTSKKSWETTRLQPDNQSGERMLEDCNQPSTCAMVWCQSPQIFWSVARFQAGKTRSWGPGP
jgi:hypothetical protein